MDVHLSLNSESELGANYVFFFYFFLFFDKNIDTNKNMVTYLDNHVLVQKKMSTCICQKQIVKTTKHMVTWKNDNIMTCSQINSRRQYFIILFSTKLYTWSHTIFYEIIQNPVKTHKLSTAPVGGIRERKLWTFGKSNF